MFLLMLVLIPALFKIEAIGLISKSLDIPPKIVSPIPVCLIHPDFKKTEP